MWKHIKDDPPADQELLLWLGPETGEDKPIGAVVGLYKKTAMGDRWVEKSISGNLNAGLRVDLITHWRELDEGPTEETI